jgi:hypothetical protein
VHRFVFDIQHEQRCLRDLRPEPGDRAPAGGRGSG